MKAKGTANLYNFKNGANSTMRRLLIVFLVGAGMSWLLFIAAYRGPSALTTFAAVYMFPAWLATSALTENSEKGEFIFWFLLTCFNALVLYACFIMITAIRRRNRGQG